MEITGLHTIAQYKNETQTITIYRHQENTCVARYFIQHTIQIQGMELVCMVFRIWNRPTSRTKWILRNIRRRHRRIQKCGIIHWIREILPPIIDPDFYECITKIIKTRPTKQYIFNSTPPICQPPSFL